MVFQMLDSFIKGFVPKYCYLNSNNNNADYATSSLSKQPKPSLTTYSLHEKVKTTVIFKIACFYKRSFSRLSNSNSLV